MRLQPGESLTLHPCCYHKLWGCRHDVMVVEVPLVNDDNQDNRLLEPVGRFAEIEGNEKSLFLLRGDYGRYWQPRR